MIPIPLHPAGTMNWGRSEVKFENEESQVSAVGDFISALQQNMIDLGERSLLVLKQTVLLSDNPFNETIIEFRPEKRRHPEVRYYRAVILGDDWQILG